MSRLQKYAVWVVASVLLAVLLVSCGPQRYPSQKKIHPKGCNCPRF